MNSTSQSSGRKFPYNPGPHAMDNRTLYVTVAVAAGLALASTLLLYYAQSGRNPANRLIYGIFMSVLPALATLVVLKLTNIFVSWRGAALVYVLLFALLAIVQAYGRTVG